MKIKLKLTEKAIEKELLETGKELQEVNVIEVNFQELSREKRNFILQNFKKCGQIFVPAIMKKQKDGSSVYGENYSVPVSSLKIQEIINELEKEAEEKATEEKEAKEREAKEKWLTAKKLKEKEVARILLVNDFLELEKIIKKTETEKEEINIKYEKLKQAIKADENLKKAEKNVKKLEKVGFEKIKWDSGQYADDYADADDYDYDDRDDYETKRRIALLTNDTASIERWTNRDTEETISVFNTDFGYFTM